MTERGPHGYRVLSAEEVAHLTGIDHDAPLFDATPQREPPSSPSVLAMRPAVGFTSTTTTNVGRYSPYDFESRQAAWEYDEPTFYRDYKRLWRGNPYAYLVAEYLNAQIFGSGFHFEGTGADAVEDFFVEDDTRKKAVSAYRQAVILGNGFLDLRVGRITGGLRETSVIEGSSIRITYDERGRKVYEQDPMRLLSGGAVGKTVQRLNPERLLHLTIKEDPETPYGISLYRPNLYFLMALEDTAGDIPAALKRIAYSPLVARLDLSQYDTEEKKRAALREMSEMLHKVISASTNYTIDSKHELSLVGAGGQGARLLPVVQLIEPLVAVVLFNFGIPLGMLIQSGSNRAILREQMEGVRRFILDIRHSFKRDVELRLVPMITGSRNARLVYDDDFSDLVRRGIFLARLYERGLVSKEFVVDELNIDDEGRTFFDPQAGGRQGQEKLPLRDDQLEDTDME